tara:strand:+ start:41 stop:1999 length:1959 start_codon:yes stop_codon:yes gene_type:complete
MAEYKKPLNSEDFLSQFDEEPEEYKQGLKQFMDQKGNRETVRVPFQDGNIVIKRNPSLRRKDDTPIVKYYFNNKEASEKTALDLYRANTIFNAPTILAPLIAPFTAKSQPAHVVLQKGSTKQNVPITKGNQTIFQQKHSNRYKKLFMGVDENLSIADSYNVTNQGLFSGIVKPTVNAVPGIQTKGVLPKYSSGAVVQTSKGTLYRPTERLESIFQMDANPTLLKDTSSDIAKFNTIYTGKTKKSQTFRETVLSDKPAAIEYRALIKKYEDINKDAPTITVGLKREELKVTPASLKDFQADVVRLKELKTELGLPNPGVFNQELGAFVKDGQRYRLGSQGYLKSTGGVELRLQKQQQIPTTEQFDPLKPKWGSFMNSQRQTLTKQLGLKKPEKDHMVRLENQLAILGKGLDKDNNFINRPPEFMDIVAGELHKRGYSLGDQNLNFLQMSEEAHRTGKYSRHIISQELTDAEFPHSYLEADQIQTKLKDGTEKWLDVEVLDFDKGTFRLKDGDNVVPNKLIKSKGNYKFAGKIYEKGQRQGLSLTTRMILASIDNPQDLAAAYMMFATDAGAHEIMTGIQTAASFIYDDASQLDPLTLEIREKNIPNMIKFLDYALETPQFKGDKVYKDLRDRFVNRLELNRREYGEQLRQRGS